MITYFFELQKRIFYILITYSLIVLLSFYYKEALLYFLVKTSIFQNNSSFPYFIYTNLTEVFNTYIQISFLFSLYLICPIIFFHFISYISPALYNFEAKMLKVYLLGSFFILVFSNLIIYNVLIPLLWNFFICFEITSLQGPLGLHFEAKLKEYIDFLFFLYLFSNISTQLFYLFLLGIFKYSESNLNFINKSRKYVYLFIFIFAAIITPPDVLSQIIIAIPLIIIYELFIFILLFKKEYGIIQNIR